MKNSLSKQRGMTLVELMVALTIGLFLTMGMSAIIVAALRQQKISASVNERDMSAVSALSQLDYYTRSAALLHNSRPQLR